jgi:hypothetical protein
MSCRTGPLRVGRSLRDLYTPLGGPSRWSDDDFRPTGGFALIDIEAYALGQG